MRQSRASVLSTESAGHLSRCGRNGGRRKSSRPFPPPRPPSWAWLYERSAWRHPQAAPAYFVPLCNLVSPRRDATEVEWGGRGDMRRRGRTWGTHREVTARDGCVWWAPLEAGECVSRKRTSIQSNGRRLLLLRGASIATPSAPDGRRALSLLSYSYRPPTRIGCRSQAGIPGPAPLSPTPGRHTQSPSPALLLPSFRAMTMGQTEAQLRFVSSCSSVDR